MNEKFKKVTESFIKLNPLVEQELVGFIPENRVLAFISALKEYGSQIELLKEEIERKEAGKQWKIPVLFRLILEFLRAVFRLNGHQVQRLLLTPENKLLLDYLNHFSEHIYLSNEEWSNRKHVFEKYKLQISKLAWKIKEKYHELIWDMNKECYLQTCATNNQRLPFNTEECLEHLNFTKFYPDQILAWPNTYPDDLMLKTFVYMKLEMISSVPQLFKRLNALIHFRKYLIRSTGVALGFYFNVPKLDKLYKQKNMLKISYLYDIVKSNAELLIKEGISDILFLIGDSTSCKARKDDPDAPEVEDKRQTLSRTHKYQAIVDGNGIPLLLYRRPDVEHDTKGFNNLKEALLELKNMTEKYGRKIEFIILDAGYFSEDAIDFIVEALECTPIIDINSFNSEKLKQIKEGIEEIKQYYRDRNKLDPKNKREIQQLEQAIQDAYKNINALLMNVQRDGTDFEQKIARLLLKISVKKYISIYRNRPIVEGLFGMAKSCYYLLGRPDRQLPIKGSKNVEIHGMLTVIAMQYLALFNYKLLGKEKNLLRSLHYIKLSELTLYY
ncbi:MAG: transposase [Candidatus Helarchaeota archaeon]